MVEKSIQKKLFGYTGIAPQWGYSGITFLKNFFLSKIYKLRIFLSTSKTSFLELSVNAEKIQNILFFDVDTRVLTFLVEQENSCPPKSNIFLIFLIHIQHLFYVSKPIDALCTW